MLLGKRPRPPIRRTTSMTGITVDQSNVEDQEPTENPSMMMDVHAPSMVVVPDGPLNHLHSPSSLGYHEQHRFLAMLSPRTNSSNHRRNSDSDLVETAHFLRTCGLCKRSLASGRDLYMYRYAKLFLISEMVSNFFVFMFFWFEFRILCWCTFLVLENRNNFVLDVSTIIVI